MVLADEKMIPSVFAAVICVASVPRTLIAVEQGARGPCKDCAYEGVYVKAITGTPISHRRQDRGVRSSQLPLVDPTTCDLREYEIR